MLDAAQPIVHAETLIDLGMQPAGARPDVGNALFDGMFGASAMENWSTAQTELLEKLHGGTLTEENTQELPSPAEVYFRHWKFPVAGLLMVAKVRRTKFDVSEPFLLVVQFPTVMPRGYSGGVFVEPSPMARLLPGQCLVPCGGTLPFLCGCLRDLRKLSPKDRELHPHAMLSNFILGFGQKAFSHVLMPVSTLPDDDAEYWQSLAQDWNELLCTPTGSLDSDLRPAPAGAYNDGFGGIRLPVMLPLASPLCLPAGILGHPSIGIDGVRAVMTDSVSTPNELSTGTSHCPRVVDGSKGIS
jgi:hypothetical protein